MDLTDAWAAAQARLPPGWMLDGLRCASTSLSPEDRSEDWIAIAIGPDGQERRYRAPDPQSALSGLADSLSST